MIRPTHACIDLDALRSNIRTIRARLRNGVRVMAVVKANCYGHGIELCVPVMIAEGVERFGVATVEEGIALRRLGVSGRIVVLPPPPVGQLAGYADHDLEAVVSSSSVAEDLAAIAAGAGRRIAVHLHVDTGMTRNGVAPSEAVDLGRRLSALDGLHVVGVASHFATSDETDRAFALEQHARFVATVARLEADGQAFDDVHMANSGGVFGFPESHHTMVRPGLALYGYHPTASEQTASGLLPVMSLRTAVGGVSRIGSGVTVSYGRSWSSDAPTTIATLPIGYADGLMRALSNRIDVLVGGARRRCVGRISMDETMVDLGATTTARRGDPVVLIGRAGAEAISAWDLAEAAGTIPYEICTNISSRVPRRAAAPGDPFTFSDTTSTLSSTQ